MKSGMNDPLQKSFESGFLHKKKLYILRTIVTVKVFQKAAEAESHYNQVLQAET